MTPPLRVYLASAASYLPVLQHTVIPDLTSHLNATVTASWVDAMAAPGPQVEAYNLRATDAEIATDATVCLTDIDRSDLMVLFPGLGRGGNQVEFGYALGRGLPVVVVGERQCGFHYLSTVRTGHRVRWYRNWSAAYEAIYDGTIRRWVECERGVTDLRPGAVAGR